MVVINVLMFGIAKEIFGESSVEIEMSEPLILAVSSLKSLLEKQQPALKGIGSYMIAVNNEFAEPDQVIHLKDEIALIPPVSGG